MVEVAVNRRLRTSKVVEEAAMEEDKAEAVVDITAAEGTEDNNSSNAE